MNKYARKKKGERNEIEGERETERQTERDRETDRQRQRDRIIRYMRRKVI